MPWNLIYDYFPTTCEQPVPEGNKMAAPLFMGFDSSTQQLKALVIDKDLKVVTEASVHFDNDFPEFKKTERKWSGIRRYCLCFWNRTTTWQCLLEKWSKRDIEKLAKWKISLWPISGTGCGPMYGWSTHFILFLPNIAPFFNFDKLNNDGCDKFMRYAALLWWLEGWIPQWMDWVYAQGGSLS